MLFSLVIGQDYSREETRSLGIRAPMPGRWLREYPGLTHQSR